MEVPEKIYRHLTTGNPRLNSMYHEYKPAKIRYNDKIIEYTRTDAFIEKACSFFRQSHHLYTLDGVELQHFIDDFRKVMKGE